MTSVENAVRYPMEHDDWIKTILIGGVLSLFAFLFVPVLLVYGYIVRVIRHSIEGRREPPVFDEWGDLLVDGIQALVIGIVYMLIPLIVGIFTVGGSIAAMVTGGRAGAAAGIAGLLVGLLVTFVLALVFGYAAVAAIVHFAHEGSIGAGFDFGALKTIMFDREYAIAWLMSVGIFIVAGIITGVLNIVPVLGSIVGIFVGFYAQVVAANLWGNGYDAARGGTGGAAGRMDTAL